MVIGAPQVVEAKPRIALPYGLFSALDLRESQDEHWLGGIEWEAMTCSPVTALADFDDPDCETQFEKEFADLSTLGEARAFLVYGSARCGVPGGRADLKAEEAAVADLLAREQNQAEAALWRRMAAQAVDVNPSGALDPAAALGALEDWLGGVYGSLGVVHGTRGAITGLHRNVKASGSRLLTTVGTPAVAGGGYPGTSPSGAAAAAGETWVYASPALFGYRGPVHSHMEIDRGVNNAVAMAERAYVVGYDPCGVAAVRMNLTCC